MASVDELIAMLNLKPHPLEGGYFVETYRSEERLPGEVLPRHGGPRSVSTAIYYLLKAGAVSELHQLPGDEIYHLYLGGPLRMLQLWPDGSSRHVILGQDVTRGERPQIVVPGGVWQGSELAEGAPFVLLGATMAPGFDYVDYRRGRRDDLIARWPEEAEMIRRLTPHG